MTDTATDWPYDADRDHPLAKLRIPVTSAWPGHWYLIAFDRESADPTEEETRLLVSYLDYTRSWYRESYWPKLLARPLDHDACHVTVIFRKWGDGDWGYRRCTWEHGPLYVPEAPWLDRKTGPLTLRELFDHINKIGEASSPRWTEWQAAHADVFPPAPEAGGQS